MRLFLALALGGVVLAGSALAESALAESHGDRSTGRRLAAQCSVCHGLDGMARIPIAPHIGGEPAEYIEHQLAAFRDGTREHEMMSIVARTLSDQQIADLAAWYSGHAASAEVKADTSGAPATCTACHGVDGMAQVPGVPNLAGETNIYIDTQLKAFRNGRRVHETMSAIASQMTDAEIRAAADWYAAVELSIDQVD